MFKKILVAALLVIALAVPLAGIALAEQHTPESGGARHGKGGKGYAGIVTNVDGAYSDFAIENRGGEVVTFMVNPDTKFNSREGELESFDDLVAGMTVGVKAVGNDEGTLVAKSVFYIDPEMLDAQRAGGEVIAVGGANFTIMSRNEEELTFQVDENTRFMSRDGSLDGFEDLEVGMKVGVLYIENDDGTFLAKAVGTGKHSSCQPGGSDGEGRPDRPDGEGRPGGLDGEGRRCGKGQPSEGFPEGDRRPNNRNCEQS